MFTGIIETLGTVVSIRKDRRNVIFRVQSAISAELKVDQSVSHSGVCLTVTAVEGDVHEVVAIQETLDKTNLGDWQEGSVVNVERCVRADGRLDGHIVQGHVDTVGTCLERAETEGSWRYRFEHPKGQGFLTVAKGSISINGISLTVVDSSPTSFSVAIIPYTFEHTDLQHVTVGSRVNLEFDIVGKYVARLLAERS